METSRPRRPRKLQDRPPIVVAPTHVSQLTCRELLGIDARRFLEFVRSRSIPAARVGKLVVAELADVRESLRDLRAEVSAVPETESHESGTDDDQPETVDEVLRLIGERRRTG